MKRPILTIGIIAIIVAILVLPFLASFPSGVRVHVRESITFPQADRLALAMMNDSSKEHIEKLIQDDPAILVSFDWGGETPLHLASHLGRSDLVRLFIAKGLDVNAQAQGDKARLGPTPLYFAVQATHLDVVKALVENGANLKIVDKEGHSASDFARYKPEILAYLREMEKQGK